MAKEDAKVIPDKEIKPETLDTIGKTPKTTSTGEFSEEKKASMDSMKSYYPEGTEINDDNYSSMMEGMIAKDYKPTKEKNGRYEEANKEVGAMMDDNPIVGALLSDMGTGAKLEQVLGKYVDLEALIDSKGGDETKWEENKKTRMANYDKAQSHKATMAANEKKSMETVKKFLAEKKTEGEAADKFAKYVVEIIDAANSGNITVAFLNAMYNGMNSEAEKAMAIEVATVKAKNEKIETKTKSEADLKKGDGMPKVASADEKVVSEPSNDFESRMERNLSKPKFSYRK